VSVASLLGVAVLPSFVLEIALQISYLTEISDPVYLSGMGTAFFDPVAPVSASLAEILDPFSLPVS
jgi:hypothetical protein